MTDRSDYVHMNNELLSEAVGDEELPDSAQLVFDVESTPVKPKMCKKKRLMLAVVGMTALLGVGIGLTTWQEQSAHVVASTINDIDLAVTPAPKADAVLATPEIEGVPVIEPRASNPLAAQTIGEIENKLTPEIPPKKSSLVATPEKAVEPEASSHKSPTTLSLSKIGEEQLARLAAEQKAKPDKPTAQKKPTMRTTAPAPTNDGIVVAEQQAQQVKPIKLTTQEKPAKRISAPTSDKIIVVRSKQVQSLPMRNLGVVAILTDGLIIKKGDEHIEVVIGELMPGLGVLQKTNPKDGTIETDQQIYKLN